MKKHLLTLLLFAGMANAQIVNIPDANFKAKLLQASNSMPIAVNAAGEYMKINTNNDTEIQVSEALMVYKLYLSSSNITDLTGIAAFPNLTALYTDNNPGIGNFDYAMLTNLNELNCRGNNMTQLNVSGLSNLRYLHCAENQIAQLSLNGLPFLSYLLCAYNPLGTLDVSGLTYLKQLNCNGTQLTQLDVSNLQLLESLGCSDNALTQLNVSGLTSLYDLYCANNPLVSLNLLNTPNLQGIVCHHAQLTSIDLSGHQYFETCILNDNQLTDLTFSYLTAISTLDISNNQIQDLDLSKVFFTANDLLSGDVNYTGNPLRTLNMKNGRLDSMMAYDAMNDIDTWEFICGDDISYEISLIQQNRPGVVVNSYCSFVPGGDYNTISGHVMYDFDNNGCDAGDLSFPNIRINLEDGTNQGAAITNTAGNYTFFTMAGSFDVTPTVENPTWFNISPVTATIPFADNQNHSATQDFCISANGTHPDLEIVIAPDNSALPGFNAVYYVVYKNKGNQALSGNILFTYNDDALDFVSSTLTPNGQITGQFSWNYTNLLPFESKRFFITFHVNTPTDTPPVNLGDILDFEATITPVAGDEIPADNVFAYHQTVVGSFASNAITCIEGAVVPPSQIGDYLHYTINFENTGTAEADNIVVKTVINPAEFDIGSLQVMDTSDPADARIMGNNAEFIFRNIHLPIGGHGHILLKIRTNDNLVAGNSVSRRADVYFDYNAPVDTGLVTTVFQNLSNTDFETDHSVTVAPNPASDAITVKADNDIQSIQLFDVQGRLLVTHLVNQRESKVSIAQYPKGIYFVKILTIKGIQVQKLFKE